MTTKADVRQQNHERVILSGRLETVTGLHVGSGYGSERTDATVVRDAWGNPFVPGSSFKGALRSTVERLIASVDGLGISSCQLYENGYHGCVTTNRQEWATDYSTLQESLDQPIDSPRLDKILSRDYVKKRVADAKRLRSASEKDESQQKEEQRVLVTEGDLLAFLRGEVGPYRLCDTCWLFGSPYNQSRLLVKDLAWRPGRQAEAEKLGEIRHGVGIDRDTQTARDQIKFDFEALPSQLSFDVELVVERPSPLDLALLAVGVQEMIHGYVPLGGIRSRGLGRCQLVLERVQQVNLGDKASLLAWLRRGTDPVGNSEVQRQAAEQFIASALSGLETALVGEG